MAEASVCLQDQGIDEDNSFGRVRWARRISNDDGGVSRGRGMDYESEGSETMTGPVDCQRQQSVDFTCYCVAKSNTASSLSRRCLVLILFSSDYFFSFTARNTISTSIMRNIFLYQVYTNLEYVPHTYRRVKKYEFS